MGCCLISKSFTLIDFALSGDEGWTDIVVVSASVSIPEGVSVK